MSDRSPGAMINVSDAGVVVVSGAQRVALSWREIRRVIAFKRDHMTTDLICLSLEAGQSVLEVNEEMVGWTDLLAELPKRLPGAMSSDRLSGEVAKPAFSRNLTVVYDRDAA